MISDAHVFPSSLFTSRLIASGRDGDHIRLSIPSGKNCLELSLSLHQAMSLAQQILEEAALTIDETREREAEIVPFTKKRRRSGKG